MYVDITHLGEYQKLLYLEKPNRLTIWNGGSTALLALTPVSSQKASKLKK